MPSSSDAPTPTPTPTHYERLRLPVTASPEELRQAFRTLSKRYHPDTTALPPAQAEEAFRGLRQAYAVLSDPQARRLYDDTLRRRLPSAQGYAVPAPPAPGGPPPARSRPVTVRRALSGGEWFALLLLAIALVLCLVLGIGVAWARGAELIQRPSWWGELQRRPEFPVPAPADPGPPDPPAAAPATSAPATATPATAAPATAVPPDGLPSL